MLLVLLAAALFVALRLRADLDDQVNNNLQARSVAAINAYREGARLAAVALEDRRRVSSNCSTGRGRFWSPEVRSSAQRSCPTRCTSPDPGRCWLSGSFRGSTGLRGSW